jgi:hypothetical protein
LEPIRWSAQLLTTMPGVSDIVARVVLSEIGTDISHFPVPLTSSFGRCFAGALASRCPGAPETAVGARHVAGPTIR